MRSNDRKLGHFVTKQRKSHKSLSWTSYGHRFPETFYFTHNRIPISFRVGFLWRITAFEDPLRRCISHKHHNHVYDTPTFTFPVCVFVCPLWISSVESYGIVQKGSFCFVTVCLAGIQLRCKIMVKGQNIDIILL